MPPTSAQTAAAAAAAAEAARSAGTKGGAQAGKLATTTTGCVMLLRKSFRPLANSWADFKNSPSKFGAIVDRVDTLMNLHTLLLQIFMRAGAQAQPLLPLLHPVGPISLLLRKQIVPHLPLHNI
jgi:hypothetical protein